MYFCWVFLLASLSTCKQIGSSTGLRAPLAGSRAERQPKVALGASRGVACAAPRRRKPGQATGFAERGDQRRKHIWVWLKTKRSEGQTAGFGPFHSAGSMLEFRFFEPQPSAGSYGELTDSKIKRAQKGSVLGDPLI